jgi:hypothetical protein
MPMNGVGVRGIPGGPHGRVESIETAIVRLIGIGPQLNPVKRLRKPLDGDGRALFARLVGEEFVDAADDVFDRALEAAAHAFAAAVPGRGRIATRELLRRCAVFLDDLGRGACLGFLPGRSAPSPAFIVRVRALVPGPLRVLLPAAAVAPDPR